MNNQTKYFMFYFNKKKEILRDVKKLYIHK